MVALRNRSKKKSIQVWYSRTQIRSEVPSPFVSQRSLSGLIRWSDLDDGGLSKLPNKKNHENMRNVGCRVQGSYQVSSLSLSLSLSLLLPVFLRGVWGEKRTYPPLRRALRHCSCPVTSV